MFFNLLIDFLPYNLKKQLFKFCNFFINFGQFSLELVDIFYFIYAFFTGTVLMRHVGRNLYASRGGSSDFRLPTSNFRIPTYIAIKGGGTPTLLLPYSKMLLVSITFFPSAG